MTLGIAATCLVLAALLIWKKKALRLTSWLMLFAGLGLSAVVLGLTGGGIGGWTIAGIAIALPLTIGLIALFWLEVIRKEKPHKIRTPLVGFALGVLLVGLGGNVGSLVSHTVQDIGNRTGTTVQGAINSNGK